MDRTRFISNILGTAVAVVILLGAWHMVSLLRNPQVELIFPENHAEWIRAPMATGPDTYGMEDFTAAFKTTFTLEERPQKATFYLRGFRYAVVYLDGLILANTELDFDTWKTQDVRSITNFRALEPGEHELIIAVDNQTGPPMVRAYCPELGIRTGRHWLVKDGTSDEWVHALTATDPQVNTIGSRFSSVRDAFMKLLPLIVSLFGLGLVWTLIVGTKSRARDLLVKVTPTPSGVRWLLLIAWAALVVNNITKLPYSIGFDVDGHLQYMIILARKGRIPLATEGWQTFQSPLYYLLSAPLYMFFASAFSEAKVTEFLRIVPMICGALQVQIAYHAMRVVYPEQARAQIYGTLLAGFLPINLYLSQNLSNEPLVAVFSSLLFLMLLKLIRDPERYWRARWFTLIGLLLGFAILTKLTAILLVPIISIAIFIAMTRGVDRPAQIMMKTAVASGAIFAISLAVCGWYFVYNWIHLGQAFLGGWDESRGYIWWQEPGYRTIQQYVTFGDALVYPVFSSVQGFWDGFYSTLWLDGYISSNTLFDIIPSWNFDFVLASAWLSLVPSAIILLGVALTLARPVQSARNGQLLALLGLVVFIAAIIDLSFTVSGFSTIKASYTLSLTIGYGILFARGSVPLSRFLVLRSVLNGTMLAWAVVVYAGYFVIPDWIP